MNIDDYKPKEASYAQLNFIKNLLDDKNVTFEYAAANANLDIERIHSRNDLWISDATLLIDYLKGLE